MKEISFLKKKYIIRVDGGICSQISQYLLGNELKKLGYNVEYDLTWFFIDGKDLDGRKNRNFDLLKLDPTIKFKQASVAEILWYKKKFLFEGKNSNINVIPPPPAYLGGYYELDPKMIQEIPDIISFTCEMDKLNKKCIWR